MDLDDSSAFRHALGTFPTGVAVITAAAEWPGFSYRHHGEFLHLGIAGPAFGVVVHRPPLAPLSPFRRRAGLHGFDPGLGHKAVSSRLAGAGEHSLEGLALIQTELGPPALANSLAVFECARESIQDAGDHAMLIGRVLRFARLDGAGPPLVYFQGKYGALAQGKPPEGVDGRRATNSD